MKLTTNIHLQAKIRARRARQASLRTTSGVRTYIAIVTIVSFLFTLLPDALLAASSWSPTLLVNTQSFQVIDDDDTSSNLELRFGDTLNEKLIYDRSNQRFKFTRSLFVSGNGVFTGSLLVNIGASTAGADTALEVIGVMSGTSVYATKSFSGAGLADCDNTTTSKLLWDATTGLFSCGTDQSGAGVTSSNSSGTIVKRKAADESVANSTVLQDDNDLYIEISANETISFRHTILFTGGSTNSIKVAINAPAGSTCAYTIFRDSGSASEDAFFSCGEENTITALGVAVGRTIFIEGTVTAGVQSGEIDFQWAQGTSTATAIVVEAGSFATFYRGSLNAPTLQNVYDNDTNGGSTVVRLSTSDDSVQFLNPASNGTDSGALLYVSNQAQKKYGVQIDSAAQGNSGALAIITSGADHIRFGSGTTLDTNLYRPAADRLKTDDAFWAVGGLSGSMLRVSGPGAVHGVLTASGNVITDGDLTLNDDRTAATDAVLTFGNATANQTLKFIHAKQGFYFSTNVEVNGTLSGTTVYATQSLRSSGSLVWEGAASGSSLYAATSIKGAGLSDCDTSATSKLLWDASTGRFSCGTDQSGSGGNWSNTGSLQTAFDGRYVNVSGDTMTGALNIQNGNTHTATSTSMLNVRGTMSGRSLQITGSGASTRPLLFTDVSRGRLGIGTNAPNAALAVSGSTTISSNVAFGSGSLTVVQRKEFGTGAYFFASGAAVLALDHYVNYMNRPTGPSILFGYRGNFDTSLYRSAPETLKTMGKFEIHGTTSGSALRQGFLSVDGSLFSNLEGGYHFGNVKLRESIFSLDDYAENWTAKDTSRAYKGVAMSSNGKYQTAVVYGGQIYTSDDYGNTWTAQDSSRNWNAVAMSADGKIQAAVVDSGTIYTSSDYGDTWTSRDDSRSWTAIDMSADGKYMAASVSGGFLYLSADFGATWEAKESSRTWRGITMNSDGKYITAVASSSTIYASRDYGRTWTSEGLFTSWQTVTMNGDGKYQTALNESGDLYTSSDFGDTWTGQGFAGMAWRSVAMSNDGRIQTAVANLTTIRTSTDFGENWTTIAGALSWSAVAMSSDGKIQTAVGNSSRIYTSYATALTYGDMSITGGLHLASGATVSLLTGSGSPEGRVAADHGSLFLENNKGRAFLKSDSGSTVEGWFQVPSTKFIVKVSDESVASSTTLQDDNELFMWAGSTETVYFEMNLIMDGNSTNDAKIAIAAPAGSSCFYGTNVDTSVNVEDASLTCGTGLVAHMQAVDQYKLVRVSGYVTTGSTAGYIRLQWAENVSGATATVVNAGSHAVFYRHMR